MIAFWIAAFLLILSVLLIFGPPLIMMGPRAVLRHTLMHPENKILLAGLATIGISLFLVTGSFIQSASPDTISARNFHSLNTQA